MPTHVPTHGQAMFLRCFRAAGPRPSVTSTSATWLELLSHGVRCANANAQRPSGRPEEARDAENSQDTAINGAVGVRRPDNMREGALWASRGMP